MAEYRWNVAENAAGFDAAAEFIHPYYHELQDQILDAVPAAAGDEFLLVDLGGGSGRLAEKFLERFQRGRVLVVDQSAPFLEIARRRLARFGDRATTLVARLQDDWPSELRRPPLVIASMSAIHHLEPAEKQELYQAVFDALAPGGVLLNGDEVRPAEDAAYLAHCQTWARHMHRLIDEQIVNGPMREALLKWEDRNITRREQPRASGDDIHETVAAQLDYFRQVGFVQADTPWHKEMWALLRGVKGIHRERS